MATVFVPTKAEQEDANRGISTLNARVETLEEALATAQMATVRVHFNAQGAGTYDIPTDPTVVADILNGARVVFKEAGVDSSYEARITSLTNFTASFTVFVTKAATGNLNSVGAVLGKSGSAGYAVAPSQFLLAGGRTYDIHISTRLVTGTKVELCRVQPYVANPQNHTTDRLGLGNSYLGTRITTASGTTLNLGHWTEGMGAWVDQSLTKVSIWDCPADGSTPTERSITTAEDTTNWVTVEERLACLRDIIIGKMTVTGDSATIDAGAVVRYSPLWIKQTREVMNMPIMDAGGVLQDNPTDCIVRWYADEQVDPDYHLHPLFVKYSRNADGSYSSVPCAHGYIARYPFGNSATLAVDGINESVPQFKSGTGREWVPGNRSVTLGAARIVNRCTAKLYFDDDGDGVDELFATLPPDSTNRTIGVAGTAEISFLQWMSYLYFGVNVQGAASLTDKALNVFPGICTTANGQVATTNGATDHIISPENHAAWGFKVWTGAVDTRLCTNSIVFLGVEDGLWSSTGWYWEDVTLVTRRTITTDASGAIASNVESTGFLIAQDAADVNPGASNISDETTEIESASFEGQLKANGYRELAANGRNAGAYWYRSIADGSEFARDACLPANDQDQSALNCGACDNFWRGGTPGNFGAFSAATAYAVGDFVLYSSKLYKCVAAHQGEWDGDDFELFASRTVTKRSYWLVALGYHRSYGAHLGSFCVYAGNALASSAGAYWRARPLLRVVS